MAGAASPPPGGASGSGHNSGKKKGPKHVSPDVLRAMLSVDHLDSEVRRSLGQSLSAETAAAIAEAATEAVSNPRPVKYRELAAIGNADARAAAKMLGMPVT